MTCNYCFNFQTKTYKCANCLTGRYCSSACQKADWPNHKKICQTKTEEEIEIRKQLSLLCRELNKFILSRYNNIFPAIIMMYSTDMVSSVHKDSIIKLLDTEYGTIKYGSEKKIHRSINNNCHTVPAVEKTEAVLLYTRVLTADDANNILSKISPNYNKNLINRIYEAQKPLIIYHFVDIGYTSCTNKVTT